MTRNPEFQRQLWLNWRPSLIAWSLGLSALVLALPLALSDPDQRAARLGITALAGLWMVTVVYGGTLAGRSLSEEARQNTWDWQRLSALSPWQMAWGKLLGATVPAWLYALWLGLATLFVSSAWDKLTELRGLSLHAVGLAVLWGLGLQAWSMSSVLLTWGQRPSANRRAATLPVLFLFVILPQLARLIVGVTNRTDSAVLWWGLNIGYIGAAWLFGALTLALGLLALWRLLCQRLDVRTLPWAWPLGLAVCGFFGAGLMNVGFAGFCLVTGWIAMLGTAFVALQHMSSHLRDWRQVQWSASRGRWREALQALPLWPVSWLLALAACVALRFLPHAAVSSPVGASAFGLALCLQLLRDGLILTGFALLAGRLRSPLAGFCIAWIVINIMLPLLAGGVAGPEGVAVAQPVFAFSSAAGPMRPAAWISLAVQLLLAALWAGWVFRDRVLGFARENAARPS